MKHRLLQLGLVLMILTTTVSCSKNDGYSLGKFYISVATVNKIDSHTFDLTLDNGQKLWPAASNFSWNFNYNLKDSQRVFVNYTLLSDQYGKYDHMVKVNDMWNILTKDVITLNNDNLQEVGHDPIRINDLWVANDFLNIGFLFNYGGIRPHTVNLVRNQLTQLDDGEEVLELEFRHNAFGTGADRLFDGLVCFDLKPFKRDDADSIKLKITYKDFPRDGEPSMERSHEVYYKYNSLSAENILLEAPVMIVSKDEYY